MNPVHMKTIGLIGGMSWHSTAVYYELINRGIQKQLGGLHSARIVMVSVEFSEIEALQRQGEWEQACDILVRAANTLQQAGADILLICTNTMHICTSSIEQAINIPFLHIADATADRILEYGYQSTGLLGTAYTMQMDYFSSRLESKGLKVIVPNERHIRRIDNVIFNELCFGRIEDTSRQDYLSIMSELLNKGAECIIQGCTEIGLLVRQDDTQIKLFDTTVIHAEAAIQFALSET